MVVSFRTRVFAVAALIVAAVLLVVLALGWQALLRSEVERLEDRLCRESRRVATQPALGLDTQRLEADLRLRLRLGPAHAMLLRLEPGGGRPPVLMGLAETAVDLQALAWRPSEREGPPPRLPAAQEGAGPPEFDLGPPPPAADDAPPRPPPPEGLPPPRGSCELAAFRLQGDEWRAARFVTPRRRAVLAQGLAAIRDEMQTDLRRSLQVVVPLALALTAAGAWMLASLSLRPVNRLRQAMQGVTRRALDQRLADAGEDREFRELIEAYNTMLARLEISFQQASRFSADAAHELKTPLTILRGRLEQALNQSKDTQLQAALTDMLDEVGRLADITRKLLLLSQADAGQLALKRERIDLSELLQTLVADAQMLAAGRQVGADVAPGLVLEADLLLLRQLFNNLLSNALRHGRPDGWLKIGARVLERGVEVVFANASAPIAAAQRARFFDRFHRGDAAHHRSVDGHGLGLSLAREIARAHGGDLRLLPGPDDEVALRLWLPRSGRG